MIFRRFIKDFKTIEDASDIYYDCAEETTFLLMDENLAGDVGISCTAILINVHISGVLRVYGTVFMRNNSWAKKVEADGLVVLR